MSYDGNDFRISVNLFVNSNGTRNPENVAVTRRKGTRNTEHERQSQATMIMPHITCLRIQIPSRDEAIEYTNFDRMNRRFRMKLEDNIGPGNVAMLPSTVLGCANWKRFFNRLSFVCICPLSLLSLYDEGVFHPFEVVN